ncbi:MAG: hypothetical protein HZB51_32285 [Chloroflexi bacterium]|nr:hypothetical protein [Chloroflexota bacterium]
MHLDEEQLKAYVDHELGERDIVEKHLVVCVDCRARMDELSAQAQKISAHLASLNPQTDRALNASTALARFNARRISNQKEIPMLGKIFNRRYRAAWAMVALVALFAVSMTFPPVQTFAQGLLAQFRVSKITVVSVNTTFLDQILGNNAMSKQIGQMLSDSVTVTKKPNKPQSAADTAQASQLAGFGVRLPTSRNDKPQMIVQDGGAMEFVVNRARAQKLIDELGVKDVQLPASLDGALIKVSVAPSVAAGYGKCPDLMASEETRASSGQSMTNCIILTQVPSPVVDTPPDLDLAALAKMGLQISGMSREQANSFAQTVDWTSTLVVPVPRNAAEHKKITVDGVEGYLIQRTMSEVPQYVIVWVKNKIIHAIAGVGTDTTAAMNMANSLK